MYRARVSEALPGLRDRIAQAALAAGRDPLAVRLVAVTKGHPLDALEAALEAGISDLGENRVEDLEVKQRAVGRDRATWHMIGHVQSRKARRAADLAHLIHSVDSLHLAEKLSRVAGERGSDIRVLAQVNTSGEGSKSGLATPGAVEEVLRVASLPHLRVEGLMTMAPFVDDTEVLTSSFRRLRETLEEVRRHDPEVGPELSMGMTNDFEIAIREGSTMVRIGTALFGERDR
jgi:pyridoxal phosphate enzyme (YggS family)